ncbi:MAG: hypothetical protein NT154_31425 [Verrucomicrobia bacterium]|nr:hypothetical protein [Verrucomicrobiota bacterium]
MCKKAQRLNSSGLLTDGLGILDIPPSGKRGRKVSQKDRYGQISRTLVIPSISALPGFRMEPNLQGATGNFAHHEQPTFPYPRQKQNGHGRLCLGIPRLVLL